MTLVSNHLMLGLLVLGLVVAIANRVLTLETYVKRYPNRPPDPEGDEMKNAAPQSTKGPTANSSEPSLPKQRQ